MYWLIDDQNSAQDNRNNAGLNYITYIYFLILILSTENEYTVDCITT